MANQTTISVEKNVQAAVKRLAAKAGVSQPKMVEKMVDRWKKTTCKCGNLRIVGACPYC